MRKTVHLSERHRESGRVESRRE